MILLELEPALGTRPHTSHGRQDKSTGRSVAKISTSMDQRQASLLPTQTTRGLLLVAVVEYTGNVLGYSFGEW